MKSVFTSHSISDTRNFSKKYLEDLVNARLNAQSKKPLTQAFILGLSGDLGSGKTAFTQAIARDLGVEDHVTSPTFVIEKIYPLTNSLLTVNSQVFKQLIHIDAYRLENSDEMKHLGWDKIIGDSANLIVIEWPERVESLLPADHARIKFSFIDETTREIEVVQ